MVQNGRCKQRLRYGGTSSWGCGCAIFAAVNSHLHFLVHASEGAYTVRKIIGNFHLIGNEASLGGINGGIRCAGADGLEAPGYLLEGSVSLEDCAQLASEQSNVKGFRWGRHSGLSHREYQRMVHHGPEETQSGLMGFSFKKLFSSTGNAEDDKYACFIYMFDDSKGEHESFTDEGLRTAPQFSWTDTSIRLNVTIREEQDQGRRLDILGKGHNRRAKPTLHAGTEVCLQRWSIAHFFKPWDASLWVCYTADSEVSDCKESLSQWLTSGIMVSICGLVLTGIFAYIMHAQEPFILCASWLARIFLNFEVAILSCWFLVNSGLDTNRQVAVPVGLLITVAGANLLHLPYYILANMKGAKPLAAFFLLLVVYSPAPFLDRLSYTEKLKATMDLNPYILGLCGCVVEVILNLLFCSRSGTKMVLPFEARSQYMPMQSQHPPA
eukprot:CAMPEP_0206436554 /NCGR_PEP_ID=MMETSP0324_2-20121206/10544_1 /ASSEMBLY_ACC=CAM_ASM_000836 /TAXON_ID=2866 /ORGANISM="Crypthecodinium cohnii, Strain Seligo" /LENGTH=438 /DNA_ID=CAMNT_0053903725 /DNA_START=109 /DNA_END=1425 /DNA_ORIENTATION=-